MASSARGKTRDSYRGHRFGDAKFFGIPLGAGHRSRSLYLARWSRHLSQPQDPGDGLGIANASIDRHPSRLRQTEKSDCDPLVRLGLGLASLQAACQVDSHSFVEKTWAYVEMQNSLPLAGAVAGFL